MQVSGDPTRSGATRATSATVTPAAPRPLRRRRTAPAGRGRALEAPLDRRRRQADLLADALGRGAGVVLVAIEDLAIEGVELGVVLRHKGPPICGEAARSTSRSRRTAPEERLS